MEEIWKDIKGYEGLYEISNLGKIKSLDKLKKNKLTSYILPGRILNLSKDGKGYLFTVLTKDMIRKHAKSHRLVAEAFIPNPDNKKQVNHIDGDKTNNKIHNLEWVTPSENVIHAHKTGLTNPAKGSNNNGSRLTEEDIIAIRESNLSRVELSVKYNVHKETIARIIRRQLWKHI